MRSRYALAPLAALLAQAAAAQPVPVGTPAEAPATAPADDTPAPAGSDSEEVQHRVVGGRPAPAGSAPWQAQIYSSHTYTRADTEEDRRLAASQQLLLAQKEDWEKVHRCGGAYIGGNIVLTAAHCVAGVDGFATRRRVRLGTQNLRVPGATFRIADWKVHPGFVNAEPYPHDIAVLRIVADTPEARRLDLRKLAIRMLGTRPGDLPVARGDRLRITGWGRTKARNSGQAQLARDGTRNPMSPVLMQISQRPDPAACAALPGYADRIADKTVCAVSELAGSDSCNGDSGGPMTRAQGSERVLVGLVSWGRGCALPGMPAVYTSVPGYLDWIAGARGALGRR